MSHKEKTGAENRVQLFEEQGAGFSGSWTWFVFLSKRKDGRYSLRIKQVVDRPPQPRTRGLYGFRDGAQLFKFLADTWYEIRDEYFEERKWVKVTRRIANCYPLLAKQVAEAVKLEFHPPDGDPTWHREGAPCPGCGGRSYSMINQIPLVYRCRQCKSRILVKTWALIT